MTDKHTPGPWIVGPSSNPKNGTGWRDILSTGGEFSPAYVGEALEQDARLIAAAPSMLEALEALFRECVMIHRFGGDAYNGQAADDAVASARAAIAQAIGEKVDA